MTADATGPDIRILGGNPTTEEIAAVTAVLTSALEEIAGEERVSARRGPSAWEASQRSIRRPLPFGAWRNEL